MRGKLIFEVCILSFLMHLTACTNSPKPPAPTTPRDAIWLRGIRASLRASYIFLSAAALVGVTKKSVAVAPLLSQHALKPSCRDDVLSGSLYVHDDYISPDLAERLRKDIAKAADAGLFRTAGLSNTANGKTQQFGSSDRSVCPVPIYSTKYESSSYGNTLGEISRIVKDLQVQLSVILKRPSLVDPQLEHESYYSIYRAGSLLPRHMDERHEEIKGLKGWISPSRRSISWLIYLSSQDTEGGQLRAYVQQNIKRGEVQCGSYEEDLQVGWLSPENTDHDSRGTLPVYLATYPDVSNALYIVERGRRSMITDRFDVRATWDLKGNKRGLIVPTDKFVTPSLFNRFYVIEDTNLWASGSHPIGSIPVDVAPVSGRLVLFDSATLPHEVCLTDKGERLALAGWFHEKQQDIV